MRILYAAGNREGSYQQLKRYLPLFNKSEHQFQIAGFKKSLKELSADYCLDALLNFRYHQESILFNGNFPYYQKEILKFKPDLIISDLEIYTSLIAIDNNIPLWQVSPALIYYGTVEKFGIRKYNKKLIKARPTHKYIKTILSNSKKKLIVSHLSDIENGPDLLPGFEWCRPEFKLNQENTFPLKSTGIEAELADAFYNERFTLLEISKSDIEDICGVYFNIHYGLGQLEADSLDIKKINIKINDNTKFLMELIK